MARTPSSSSTEHVRPVRTLGDVLRLLPFREAGQCPLLELDPLPNDTVEELTIPGYDDDLSLASDLTDRGGSCDVVQPGDQRMIEPVDAERPSAESAHRSGRRA